MLSSIRLLNWKSSFILVRIVRSYRCQSFVIASLRERRCLRQCNCLSTNFSSFQGHPPLKYCPCVGDGTSLPSLTDFVPRMGTHEVALSYLESSHFPPCPWLCVQSWPGVGPSRPQARYRPAWLSLTIFTWLHGQQLLNVVMVWCLLDSFASSCYKCLLPSLWWVQDKCLYGVDDSIREEGWVLLYFPAKTLLFLSIQFYNFAQEYRDWRRGKTNVSFKRVIFLDIWEGFVKKLRKDDLW